MLAEQILRLYYGGNIPSNGHITKFDVFRLIEQFGNQELKAERFNINLPEGDIYPANSLVASYDGVDVVAWKTKSKAKLPAVPIAMPRGLGVWHVSAAKINGDDVDRIDEPYIPLQSGQYGIIKGLKELGEISGLVGYEPVNGEIIFTENIYGQGVTKVFIQLLVADIASVDEYDFLPITPDMESRIVVSCLEVMRSIAPADRAVDGTDKR
jgi:hypothetical protein